jgi:hypothetical protein
MSKMIVTFRRADGCFLAGWLLVLVGSLAGTVSVATASSSTSEEALRGRVQECYNALQSGDWKKVEKYLTKDSKPIFRNQPKWPLNGYEIQSVTINPDGQTASVVVLVPVTSAVIPKPFPVPRTTQWRLVNHAWYLELSKPGPANAQSVFDQIPKGPINTTARVGFSRDLQFDTVWASFGTVGNNDKRQAKFSFKNVSTHPVTLANFQLGCECLRLKTQQMEYKPGETGTLEIEFDPSKLGVNFEESFQQDIVFKTQPGGAYVKLTVAALLTGSNEKPSQKP